MPYAIYFRETVTQRCHVKVDDCTDIAAAIEAARQTYANAEPDERRDIELDGTGAEIEIFAADEFDAHGNRVRSWELDDISAEPGSPIDLEP